MLFIFDENFPIDFVHGLAILEKANRKSSFPVEVVFSNDFMGTNGSTDEEIIIACAGKNAVIVTHDNDFKRIKHYKPLLVDNKVGYNVLCYLKAQSMFDLSQFSSVQMIYPVQD